MKSQSPASQKPKSLQQYFEEKTVSSNKIPPKSSNLPDLIDSQYPWGNLKKLITGPCRGKTTFLGEHIHVQFFFSKPGQEQIIQLRNHAQFLAYQPQTPLTLEGKVKNPETYPLFNLQLSGLIYRLEENKTKAARFGNPAVENFLIWEKANLPAKGEKKFKHLLQIPRWAPAGNYALVLYLNQDRRFPLRGHAYLRESLGEWYNPRGVLFFQVKSRNKKTLEIDRSSVNVVSKAKNKKVSKSQNLFAPKGGFLITLPFPDLELKFDLVNQFSQKQRVDLVFDLMEVRGDERNKKSFFSQFIEKNWNNFVEKETVVLKPRSRRRFSFRLNLSQRAKKPLDCVLAITAISSRSKSIAYFPLTLKNNLDAPIFIWPGLDRFPLKKGQKFNLFAGFSSSYPTEGKVQLELVGRKNQTITQLSFQGIINQFKRAWKIEATAPKDLRYLKLIGKIYNKEHNLIDGFERVYDSRLLKLKNR